MYKIIIFLIVINVSEICNCNVFLFRSLITNPANLSWNTATSGSQQKLIKDYLSKEQEIYITVYKAHNLTCRSSNTPTEDDIDSENIAGKF